MLKLGRENDTRNVLTSLNFETAATKTRSRQHDDFRVLVSDFRPRLILLHPLPTATAKARVPQPLTSVDVRRISSLAASRSKERAFCCTPLTITIEVEHLNEV
jgi:hypothetical protein